MKALSIKQPWAHLIVHGLNGKYKTIETREWQTQHRGELLIVSSKKPDRGGVGRLAMKRLGEVDLDYGKAIGVVELLECRAMTPQDEKAAMCPMYTNAYSWVMANVRPIEPFAVKGKLRLYDLEYEQ